ncbi:MAG TPA: hypothetical protein VKZ44_05625 [Taishania sp.]|nr:hypothetical protein [Taishania sp.]
MNEKIQHIIQDIRLKKDALLASLNQQRQDISTLENEVSRLKSELAAKDSVIADLKSENEKLSLDNKSQVDEISTLKAELVEVKNQIVIQPESKEIDQEQIDEMVREIEYCIGQLKNNA